MEGADRIITPRSADIWQSMYLRSGYYVPSGNRLSDIASNISSEESVTQRGNLETIAEDSLESLSTSSDSSMASENSNQVKNAGTTIKYNMTLEYLMDNPLGAKIYVDPLGRRAVRVDDHEIEFCTEVPVSVQGDGNQYMDPYATMYVVTEDPMSMNKWGLKDNTDSRNKQPVDETERPPQLDPKLYKLIDSIPCKRIKVDDQGLGLYRGDNQPETDMYLQIRGVDPEILVEHKIIYVFVKTDLLLDPGMTYRDAYDIEYERVPKTVVSTYLCGGLPLFDAISGVGVGIPKPATSAQSHTRASNIPHPNLSARPHAQMTISGMPLPTNAAKVGEKTILNGGYSAGRQPLNPQLTLGTMGPMGDFPGRPSGAPSNPRKIRPSDFKKLVDKFDGSKDPYNHMANFRQVMRAEQVFDWHTQFEGFGMTLDSVALSWFQAIPRNTYSNLEDMEKDFIEAFSKTGIKHNTVALIYNFKQASHESVRECSNRLRQYILRCPNEEVPSQERLVSKNLS